MLIVVVALDTMSSCKYVQWLSSYSVQEEETLDLIVADKVTDLKPGDCLYSHPSLI